MSDDILIKQLRKAAKHERGKTYRVSDTDLGQQLADITESRAIFYERAADTIERLSETLRECGADFISRPCTVPEGAALLAEEFCRRANLARTALDTTKPADGGNAQ